jgi:hypothetical protein
MPEAPPPVLLLSSNRTRRYSEDILTALAAPPGSVIRFRYHENLVAPSLQQVIADKSVFGRSAVIGFIGNRDAVVTPDGPHIPDPVMVPIRMVSVISVEDVGNIYVFHLRVLGHPDVSDMPTGMAEVSQESKKFYDKLVESNGGYFPATARCPNQRLTSDGDPARLWIQIVQRLAAHPTFNDTYFVRIGSPAAASRKRIEFDGQGRLRLGDGQSIKLPVTFYGKKYYEAGQVSLSCATDYRYLRVSSADKYDVASRYDSVEFWLQPQTESFDALAGVAIKLAVEPRSPAAQSGANAGPVPLTTHAYFPVIVVRSRSRLAVKVSASAVGAFLVALPGILGQASSLPLRVISAVAGALLIAYAAIVMSRPGNKLSLDSSENRPGISANLRQRSSNNGNSAGYTVPIFSRAVCSVAL